MSKALVTRKRAHFPTIESYFEVAKSFEWEPVQLSQGPLDLHIATLDTNNFGLFEMRFAARVHDRTVIRKGYVSFCLLEGQCTSAGIEIEPPALAVLPDTRDFRTTFEPSFSCREFFFLTEVVEDHALGEWALSPRRSNRELIVPLSEDGAARVAKIFQAVMDNLEEDSGPDAVDVTEQAILDELHSVLSAHRDLIPPEPRRRSRPLLVERGLQLLDKPDFQGESSELARQLKVSRRTLELAFQQVIGVSPGRFILTQRLNRVRKALDSDEGGVIEVAMTAGFEHPSRFSGQYKRLFGELPSRTLQRARERLEVD